MKISNNKNAFCIAGTSSGVGKTVITLALIRAMTSKGKKVQPFKCGPDYIDTEYHSKSAYKDSYNLDTWMMGDKNVRNTFERKMQNADIGIIEGVMGLFDGAEVDSLVGSTASVANILKVPIILVVNAKSMAQSISAVVKGYNTLYSDIKISGIIANNVNSKRHKEILSETLKKHKLPPLIGAIPSDSLFKVPERHLGLVPTFESDKEDQWLNDIAEIIEGSVDLDLLMNVTVIEKKLAMIKYPEFSYSKKIRVGIAYDEAFHFYYKDNLDLLELFGFELVKFSPLNDTDLPVNLDFLYFGGGFPETFAEQLSVNCSMIGSVKTFAENNGIIFAECGGYMYLVESFEDVEGNNYPMCGLLKGKGKMKNKLQNFGYKQIKLKEDCLLGKAGTKFKGHEFHWSVIDTDINSELFMTKGVRESKWYKSGQKLNNVFASYIHIHFLSNLLVVENIRNFVKKEKEIK